MKYLFCTLLIVLFTLMNLLAKTLTLFIYPIAYFSRKWIRKKIHYENYSTYPLYNEHNVLATFLWFFLDDSIWLENTLERGVDKEYCVYGKQIGVKGDFLKSYYWGALRNSVENFLHYIQFGKIISFTEVENKFGKFRIGYHEKVGFPVPFFDIWKLSVGFYKGTGKFTVMLKLCKRRGQ